MQKVKLYPSGCAEKLEFNKILDFLRDNCISSLGTSLLDKITFSNNLESIQKSLKEVAELKSLLEQGKIIPTYGFCDLGDTIRILLVENSKLSIEAFKEIYVFQLLMEELNKLFKNKKVEIPEISGLFSEVIYDDKLIKQISRVISEEGEIRSGYSSELDAIRKELRYLEKRVDGVMNSALKSYSNSGYLTDEKESFKNGKRVLSVLSEHKRKIRGVIHDESSSGKITYIEPEETLNIYNEIIELQLKERREIHKILLELTNFCSHYISHLKTQQIFAAKIDFIRAKSLLAIALNATLPKIEIGERLLVNEARHPVLYLKNRVEGKEIVPLSFELTNNNRILIISGPNAGGKSIALKTVGLLQLMLQSGMLVPVKSDSIFRIYNKIFVELGDEQSIENELSTYSSRLKHIKYILENADTETLFLSDEFGTGTDPRLGGVLGETILEELNEKKCFGVVNTHYSNIKILAENTVGMLNGSMLYNSDTFQPLYVLKTGVAGSSFTFEVAQKIGISKHLIAKAKSKINSSALDYEKLTTDLLFEKEMLHSQNKNLTKSVIEYENLIATYKKLKSDLETRKEEIIEKVKEKERAKWSKRIQRIDQFLLEMETHKKVIEQHEGKKKDNSELRIKEIKEKFLEEKQIVQIELNVIKDETKMVLNKAAPLEIGDVVNIIDSKQAGTIEQLRGTKALVNFGDLRTLIELSELQRNFKQKVTTNTQAVRSTIFEKAREFKTDIDLRGMRTEEAIAEIERLLDNAIMLGQHHLRILHGTGNGILRRAIRALLSKYKEVASFNSEKPELGGDGITLVELK